jgi:tRNA G18 (ribose-2'-O)-methylase SpoU
MGTVFSVPVSRAGSWEPVRDWCRARDLAVVATSSHSLADIWSTPLPERCLMLFGNEGEGLPRHVVDECDLALRIPMAHGGSLNLGVAVAVALFEYRRQHSS